jgi:hypothetical protein
MMAKRSPLRAAAINCGATIPVSKTQNPARRLAQRRNENLQNRIAATKSD